MFVYSITTIYLFRRQYIGDVISSSVYSPFYGRFRRKSVPHKRNLCSKHSPDPSSKSRTKVRKKYQLKIVTSTDIVQYINSSIKVQVFKKENFKRQIAAHSALFLTIHHRIQTQILILS